MPDSPAPVTINADRVDVGKVLLLAVVGQRGDGSWDERSGGLYREGRVFLVENEDGEVVGRASSIKRGVAIFARAEKIADYVMVYDNEVGAY